MRALERWLSSVAIAVAIGVAAPTAALAKTDVTITDVKLPDGPPSKELERTVRTAIAKAASGANFGKTKHVELSIRLSEMTVEVADGVVRVTCTLSGKLKGGGTARSHVTFGDVPRKKKKLTKQVLKMAAEGVVARLADVLRDRETAEKKKDASKDKKKKSDKASG